MGTYYETLNLINDEVWLLIARDTNYVRYALILLIGGVVTARLVRVAGQRRRHSVEIDYVDGPIITQPKGLSLLDMSKSGGVPHASICGGRGRCSTCRVRILSSANELDPASDQERKVLQRVHADDHVRLACQLHPTGDLKVIRLLPPETTLAAANSLDPSSSGREQIATIMFVDIRDFTSTSEARLPFDVVYLINQFSLSMGKQVETHHGRIDKFLGDGFMALFGIHASAKEGAINAIAAAEGMLFELDLLNQKLASDLESPLRIGIGIHTGSVIIGEMGYGAARSLTAIGDTVNVASRLEAATKTESCIICVSSDTVKAAELVVPEAYKRHISVRGKKEKLSIYALDHTNLPIREA